MALLALFSGQGGGMCGRSQEEVDHVGDHRERRSSRACVCTTGCRGTSLNDCRCSLYCSIVCVGRSCAGCFSSSREFRQDVDCKTMLHLLSVLIIPFFSLLFCPFSPSLILSFGLLAADAVVAGAVDEAEEGNGRRRPVGGSRGVPPRDARRVRRKGQLAGQRRGRGFLRTQDRHQGKPL